VKSLRDPRTACIWNANRGGVTAELPEGGQLPRDRDIALGACRAYSNNNRGRTSVPGRGNLLIRLPQRRFEQDSTQLHNAASSDAAAENEIHR
jgi:hypothetical protein